MNCKSITIKTLNEKYATLVCDNVNLYNTKEDVETSFQLLDYLGYLYIPKDMAHKINGYLSEADDKICIQNHLSEYYKTKVVEVTDKTTKIIFVNYHIGYLCMCDIENEKYLVEGNVLIKKDNL
jgi:hypothetical protein